jgi:hypothetical protein
MREEVSPPLTIETYHYAGFSVQSSADEVSPKTFRERLILGDSQHASHTVEEGGHPFSSWPRIWLPRIKPAANRRNSRFRSVLRCHKLSEIGRLVAYFDHLWPNRKRRRTRWRRERDGFEPPVPLVLAEGKYRAKLADFLAGLFRA